MSNKLETLLLYSTSCQFSAHVHIFYKRKIWFTTKKSVHDYLKEISLDYLNKKACFNEIYLLA